jgi:DNA-binding IclR family transcriptional regulator
MGGRALRSNDLRSVSCAELEALAQSVGEAATLELLVGTETMILEELPSSHVVAPSQSVGTRYPAHATSTGKVLLANLADDVRRDTLRLPLRSCTPRTISSPDELDLELRQVRQQGYAIAVEELEPDFVAVAAPVYDHNSQVVAAISVGGPSTRLPQQRLLDLIPIVKEAADRISRRLGYRD